jgi:hypothetical protein
LNSNHYLLPSLTIHNRTKSTIVVLNARLKANNSEYIAKPWGQDSWEIVSPNETSKITLIFELNKPLGMVLKDPVELNLVIKAANEINEISIPMTKKFG